MNLTKEASGKPGTTPYFPCMPYDPEDGHYYLGRAFLQSAFWIRNFNLHISWLAQAPGPGLANAGLGIEPTVIADTDDVLNFYSDDGHVFADSWAGFWTPLDDGTVTSNGTNGGDSALSVGAKAGIGIGAAAVGIILLAAGAFFWTRERRYRRDAASKQQPQKSDETEERKSEHTHFPNELSDAGVNEVSGTRDPAELLGKMKPGHELPGHEPAELGVPDR